MDHVLRYCQPISQMLYSFMKTSRPSFHLNHLDSEIISKCLEQEDMEKKKEAEDEDEDSKGKKRKCEMEEKDDKKKGEVGEEMSGQGTREGRGDVHIIGKEGKGREEEGARSRPLLSYLSLGVGRTEEDVQDTCQYLVDE